MRENSTKARLLEAAGEEFAQKGFEGTTVRDILTRAKIKNLGAVNYYFGDVEQLYTQAVIEAHRCGVELPTDDEFDAGTPAERLRRFIGHFFRNILAIQGERAWYHALMLREMVRPTRASETLVREVIGPKFLRLIELLRVFCPEAEEKRLNALAFSVIGQCLHYKLARSISERLVGAEAFARLDAEYLTDHITSFCLAALGQAPPLDEAGEPAGAGATVTAAANGGDTR